MLKCGWERGKIVCSLSRENATSSSRAGLCRIRKKDVKKSLLKFFILPTWTRWKGASRRAVVCMAEVVEYVSIMNFHSLNLKIVWYRNVTSERERENSIAGNFNSINFFLSRASQIQLRKTGNLCAMTTTWISLELINASHKKPREWEKTVAQQFKKSGKLLWRWKVKIVVKL